MDYPQQDHHLKKLRSPLLDGKIGKKKNNSFDNNSNWEENDTDPLNSIPNNNSKSLFDDSEKVKIISKNDILNKQSIDGLELLFKIITVLIISTGGVLSILELVALIKTISSGNNNYMNSSMIFAITSITTLLATMLCLSFSHLIKITKYTYINIELQKNKLEELTYKLSSKLKILN